MANISKDLLWFVQQLQQAETILSNAIDKSEKFNEIDKLKIDKIINEVQMVDLTLLQLLTPNK